MANIKPRKIQGVWADGFVLDLHSTSSTLLGHNAFGHPEFETHRTEMGELLYRLKYKVDQTALTEIADTAERFLRAWSVAFSTIVPVPPTATRKIQPLFQIVDELGRRLSVPVTRTAIRKKKQISELKNVYDFEERRHLLEDAFAVNPSEIEGRKILVIDDLYRSGATLNAVAEALTNSGASMVYALALTQTRKNV